MAISIFAKVGTIAGESRDARHQDEIDVLSWSWGVSQSGTTAHGAGGGAGAGAGAGKATFRELSFTHHIDRASPSLMQACATGKRLPDATITVRAAGEDQREYLVVTMTDVLVTSVSVSLVAEGGESMEVVALTFAKVDLEYKPQAPDGGLAAGVHFTYDLAAGSAG